MRRWNKPHVDRPRESTAATEAGYEIAKELGLGEKAGVWQLSLRDGERGFFLTLGGTPPKSPWFIRVEDFHAKVHHLIRVMAAVVDGWAQRRAVT